MNSLLLGATLAALPPAGVVPDVTVYEGAVVWDDGVLGPRDVIVSGGRILGSIPDGATVTRVSMGGKYVVPALANAHTHLTAASEAQSWDYLKDGVFYAWNPNLIWLGDEWADFMARPDTYDVVTSYGGLTEPGGHPERLYVKQLRQWVYKDRAEDSFLGDAFHYARTEEEGRKALDQLTAQGAGFVKMLLVFSEEYSERRDDPERYGSKGLNPAMVPFLVREATARGMPAYFHVETDFDLRTAALAGAQFAGHLPGYIGGESPAYAISDETVAAMVAGGMVVVPTYGLGRQQWAQIDEADDADVALREKAFAVQGANLAKLAAAGVPILTGTDSALHVRDEMQQWVDVGGMDWSKALESAFTTARYLFPDRRIQCFAPGCEADFLVLGTSPEAGVAALEDIEMRVKAGRLLEPPAPKPAG